MVNDGCVLAITSAEKDKAEHEMESGQGQRQKQRSTEVMELKVTVVKTNDASGGHDCEKITKNSPRFFRRTEAFGVSHQLCSS